MADQTPARPRNVVVVDADNPLVEVQGEFFWREDHDAILAAAREEAYRRGYVDGHNDASARSAPVTQVVLRRRRPLLTRLAGRVLVLVLVLAFVAAVLMTLVDELTARV